MQMCPDCGRVYDESEYSKCPFCSNDDYKRRYHKVIKNASSMELQTVKDPHKMTNKHIKF